MSGRCIAAASSCQIVSSKLNVCPLWLQVEQQLRRRLAQQFSAIETALRRAELDTQALAAEKAAVSA